MDFKKVNNYITLSLSRIMENGRDEEELIHLSAVRFRNKKAVEYIDVFVENSKKIYNASLNKRAYPYMFVIGCLYSWLENDIIILHEGGRKDIEWLSFEITKNFQKPFLNQYINIEDIALYHMNLVKSSLKEIAKHFGVYRINSDTRLTKDLHKCYLIHEIWTAFKDNCLSN